MTKILNLIFMIVILFNVTAVSAETAEATDKNCRVNFLGTVDTMSMSSLLDEVMTRAEDCEEIFLFIDSMGGEVSAGLFVLPDLVAINLHTHIRGEAGSMAVALFMAGDTRTMSPDAELYLHRASGGVDGTFDQIKKYAERLNRQEKQYAQFIADRAGVSYDRIFELMQADGLLSAVESLKLGLATGIEAR